MSKKVFSDGILKINGQEIGPVTEVVIHNDQSNRIAEDPATFKREYLGLPVRDEEYDLFVRAWVAYHEAADRVDGHLSPGHPDQSKLGHIAVLAGKEAMAKYVPSDVIMDIMKKNDYVRYNKWQSAKIEALRYLRKI